MKFLSIIGIALILSACTDATFGKVKALGSSGHVVCYSGNIVIYDGFSTGKIQNSSHSDGYYFQDNKTNKLVEVSGNCVITYN